VDPVGAALADKKGISAIIISGKDLNNFGRMLSGKEFKGSIIYG
jgi:uridylate kinase